MSELQAKDWMELAMLVAGFGVAWERLRNLTGWVRSLQARVHALEKGRLQDAKDEAARAKRGPC